MSNITIENKTKTPSGWQFTVVTTADTTHTVIVDRDYFQEITPDEVSVKKLVAESFVFLLEREPASAILSEFNLKDIETYFSEYPRKISDRLKGGFD